MAEGIGIPSGYGGLVRYYDEYKSKLQIKPIYVIILVILVAMAGIALTRIFGTA